ncbi:MAG: LptF/LptG family permease [Methylacidiphilales bacterium]|nr:LptF/LptG family permease [Candidatus Methylacidiphilales bacterium]
MALEFIRIKFIRVFMLIFAMFIAIYVFIHALSLNSKFSITNMKLEILFQAMFYSIFPDVVQTILPATAFFATLYFIYSMINNRELIALCSLGFGFDKLIKLVYSIIFPIAVIAFVMVNFVVPRVFYERDVLFSSLYVKNKISDLKERSFSSFGNDIILFLGSSNTINSTNYFYPTILFKTNKKGVFVDVTEKLAISTTHNTPELVFNNGSQLFLQYDKPEIIIYTKYKSKSQTITPKLIFNSNKNVYYPTSELFKLPINEKLNIMYERCVGIIQLLLFPIIVIILSVKTLGNRTGFKAIPIIFLYFITRSIYANLDIVSINGIEPYTLISWISATILFMVVMFKRKWNLQ